MDPINPNQPATPAPTNNAQPAAQPTAATAPAPAPNAPTTSAPTAPLVPDAGPALTADEIDAAEDAALAEVSGRYADVMLKPEVGKRPVPRAPQSPATTQQQAQQPTQQQPTDQLVREDEQPTNEQLETDDASGQQQPQSQQPEAIAWNDQEKQVVRDAGYDPDSKFIAAMSGDERNQFLSDALDRVNANPAQQQQQQPGQRQPNQQQQGDQRQQPERTDQPSQQAQQQQSQQQQAVAIKDDPNWQGFVAEFGEGAATAARAAVGQQVDAEVQRRIQPLQAKNDAMGQMVEDVHFATALAQVKVPAGVNKDSPVFQQNLRDEAIRQIHAEKQRLGPRFDLRKFNLLQAVPKAAAILFNPQTQTAAVQQQQESRRRALHGTAEPVTRKPTTRRAMTEDERDDAAAQAALSGKSPAEIAAAYAGTA